MYRNRNLDIFVAGGLALLGGAAYAVHVPGPLQVVLGVVLFFTPGYLWSQAILTHRLPGLERVLTSAGLTLILPIIGGFLFFVLRIPLFKPDWVGLLVVLTLLGLVAVAVQRLRQPEDPRQQPGPDSHRDGLRALGGLSLMNVSVYGLAALVALGAVGFSVKNADAQKFPGDTALYMSPVIKTNAAQVQLANPRATPILPGQDATQAHLGVQNHEGKTEQYEVKLLKNGKVTETWTFTLANGNSWQQTISYTSAMGTPTLEADLYLLSDTSNIYRSVNNGEHPVKTKSAVTKSASKTK